MVSLLEVVSYNPRLSGAVLFTLSVPFFLKEDIKTKYSCCSTQKDFHCDCLCQ